MSRLLRQVPVLRKEYTPERSGAIEQRRIGERRSAILGGGEHVYTPTAQPGRDRPMHMVIHVQADRQQRFRWARKRSTIGGTGVLARSSSTRARRRAMSSSSSA